MGEHKHNLTAIAARNGALPPKQKPMPKRELERLIMKRLALETGAARLMDCMKGGED